MKPKEIIENLKKTDIKLEAILNFLHECHLNDSVSLNTSFLEKAKVNISFLEVEKNPDLSVIRDYLLDQVNFSKKS